MSEISLQKTLNMFSVCDHDKPFLVSYHTSIDLVLILIVYVVLNILLGKHIGEPAKS